jgi:hypothetical protein
MNRVLDTRIIRDRPRLKPEILGAFTVDYQQKLTASFAINIVSQSIAEQVKESPRLVSSTEAGLLRILAGYRESLEGLHSQRAMAIRFSSALRGYGLSPHNIETIREKSERPTDILEFFDEQTGELLLRGIDTDESLAQGVLVVDPELLAYDIMANVPIHEPTVTPEEMAALTRMI